MEITIRKIKKKDIKMITRLFKKIGLGLFNTEVSNKHEAGMKIIKTIIEKYEDIDVELTEFIEAITNLNAEQIEDLDVDAFTKLLKDIWAKNNIMGFIKSEK